VNHLDILIAAFIAFGAYKGYKNGLVMEVATLVGLILGVYLAIIASDIVGLVVKGMVDWNPLPFQVIAFLLVFALVTFSLKFVAILVEKVFKVLLVNFINKLAGLILGAFKFAIIAGIALLLIASTGIKLFPESTRTDSLAYSSVTKLVNNIFPEKDYLGLGKE
jgi:membrane protein required for colicin V production